MMVFTDQKAMQIGFVINNVKEHKKLFVEGRTG